MSRYVGQGVLSYLPIDSVIYWAYVSGLCLSQKFLAWFNFFLSLSPISFTGYIIFNLFPCNQGCWWLCLIFSFGRHKKVCERKSFTSETPSSGKIFYPREQVFILVKAQSAFHNDYSSSTLPTIDSLEFHFLIFPIKTCWGFLG